MGGMSAGTATGTQVSRRGYAMPPVDELYTLAAELQPRALTRPNERRLMGTMPGEQPRHFAEAAWMAPMPAFGTTEPISASRRLAREAADHLSGLASGVSDSLAEWRRERDVAEYQGLPEWQKSYVAAADMADVLADGATLGFGNKLAAVLGTLTSDETYDQLLAKNRAATQGAYNRAGLAGDAIGLVGGLGSGKKFVDMGLGFSRLAPKAVYGAPKPDLLKRLGDFGKTSALTAADGAVVGAVDAIGHDTDVGTGAATGAAVGFVLPGAVKTVGAVFSPFVKKLSSNPAFQAIVNLPESGRVKHDLEKRAGTSRDDR